MAKSKPPTQQEFHRQRKKREERERVVYLPPGLVNHGNTCFMNSVLQGLLATQLLSDLAYFNPINPVIQRTAALPIVPSRSPQLMNGHSLAGHHKVASVGGMPIGDVFLDTLDRAWFAQAHRRRDIHSPRALLTMLGRKYDQYLDFAQQDAHEFLRILLDAMRMEEFDIIKIRQPPTKKRRRTTLTPASVRSSQERRLEPSSSVTPPNSNTTTTPQTNGVLPDEKLPLVSFVDMVFGGQLTSILVCQKCKRVSQTYEDFNDISLSLKPEDYRSHRNRERFKKLVGRLTGFPSTSNHAHGKEKLPLPNAPPVQPHTVHNLHSSSVPSMGYKGSDGVSSGSGPEGPLMTASGKKGLKLGELGVIVTEASSPSTVEAQGQVNDVRFQEKDNDNDEAESDSSHIIVNVTGPEDRHVEFLEPKKDKEGEMGDQETKDVKERKHEEAAWARLGRRISLNLGLGRQKDKDKDKQERERKTKSMDRTPLTFSIKEGEYIDTQVMQKSFSVGAAPSIPSTSNLPKNRVSPEGAAHDAELSQHPSRQLTPFATTPKQDQSLQPSSQDSASSIPPKFYAVQRSRSPKPPKPTAAETQYLRRVLADVSPPSINPLLMLRPSLLHSHSNPDHLTSGSLDKEKEKNLGSMWLGLGARPFTGIEECLRMFTAVEVLDGENMVGCRRCWKIQNGLQSKRDDSDQEDEEEGGDEVPSIVPATPLVEFSKSAEGTRPPLKVLQPSLSIVSPTSSSSPVHFQASQSTPTMSFYSQTDSRSLASLPTSLSDANLSMLHARRAEENSSGSPLSLSVISEGSIYSTVTTENDGVQFQGPGGLPIPIISTTAFIDAPGASTPTPSESSSESHYLSASEGQVSAGPNSQEQMNREAAYARLTGAVSNGCSREPHQASYSRDSLVIPPKPRYGNKKMTPETSTDDGSSSDETDTSIGMSVSAESVVTTASDLSDATGAEASVSRRMYDAQTSATATSEEPSQNSSSQQQLPESGKLQKKPSKPRPVIMRPAYKRYLIATPPPVLVIHLKRFRQTSKSPLMLSFSNGFKKLDDYVSFPESLDLSPFLAPRKEDYGLGKKGKERTKEKKTRNTKNKVQEERCMYRLYAVVVHIGNMLGGHYIAYTALPSKPPMHRSSDKSSSAIPSGDAAASTPPQVQLEGDIESTFTPPSGSTPLVERQWAYISDTVVRLTTLEEVLSSKAYICMYERC